MAHHDHVVLPLVLRRVTVARAHDVTPRMRRVTVTGEELGELHRDGRTLPAFTSPGFDDHVKIVLASDGDVRSVLPTQVEHGIEWAPSATRVTRDYTPRRFDPATRELDLDFVLHGSGPAATWARDARVGDELWFAGPRASTVPPADAAWTLLAGDETALPAIGRFFDERPVAGPVRAVVTIADPSARQDLAVRDGDLVEWVVADPHDPDALAGAVDRLDVPPGTPYVWAAAESRGLLTFRRRVAKRFAAPKSHTNITGYWHRSAAEPAEGTTSGGTAEALPASPVGWFAVRAALRLGLVDALADADGGTATTALAHRLGAETDALDTLLDALALAHVVARGIDGNVTLTPLGDELADDEHARERYDGLHAEQVLALTELAPGAVGPGTAWARTHGHSLRELVEKDAARYEELVEDARGLVQLVDSLRGRPIGAPGARVGITGPGALVLADVVRAGTGADVAVVETREPLEALRTACAEAGGTDGVVLTDRWDGVDVAVTALALEHRTDDEAVALLTALRAAVPTAVLVERTAPDGLDADAAGTAALLQLATLGTARRDRTRLAELAAAAGWTVTAHERLGWGVEHVELTRRTAP